MERPLIALTCGGLGTDVVDVESKLKKYMSWGEVWNGVVRSDKIAENLSRSDTCYRCSWMKPMSI
jgi:hypothetical protein